MEERIEKVHFNLIISPQAPCGEEETRVTKKIHIITMIMIIIMMMSIIAVIIMIMICT